MRHNAPLLHHMSARGVALAVINDKKEFIDLGSGTYVVVGGRCFVATAAHVISPYRSEDIVLVSSERRAVRPVPFVGRGHRGGGKNDLVDVAWLEVAPSVVSDMGKEVVELARCLPECASVENDVVFAYGNPYSLIAESAIARKEIPIQPIGYSTVTLPPRSKARAEADIVIEYALRGNILADGREFDLPEPHGVSGGSLWKMNVTKSGLWSAFNAQMIGISHTYHRRRRQIQGTQIQHWCRMLAEDIPALAATVANHLHAQPRSARLT